MKSLLVKIASVAVMLHMTFGCSMHHGFGNTACAHQHETACDHESDKHDEEHHGHHDHEHHDQLPDSEPAGDIDEKSQAPCHADCSNDGCHVTQFVQFKFQALDFSVPYFGSVDALALVESQSCRGFDVDPFPDPIHARANMRAHLQFGVQIV